MLFINNLGEVSLIMDHASLIQNKFSNIWPHFLLFEILIAITAPAKVPSACAKKGNKK